MTPVEQVRSICRERGIAVSQLERECGFSNGYLNPKKLHKLPYDRAVRVAEYLDLPVQSLLEGEHDGAGAPAAVIPDSFTYAMLHESESLTPEDKALLLSMARQLKEARTKTNGESG